MKPAILAGWVDWTPFDRHASRLYGGGLLALAFGSWLGYRATRREEVRILVLLEIAFSVLSVIGGLWIFFSMGPNAVWAGKISWAAFAGAFGYFYLRTGK